MVLWSSIWVKDVFLVALDLWKTYEWNCWIKLCRQTTIAKKVEIRILSWHWKWPLMRFHHWIVPFLLAYVFQFLCIRHLGACRLQAIPFSQNSSLDVCNRSANDEQATNLHLFTRTFSHWRSWLVWWNFFIVSFQKFSINTSCISYILFAIFFASLLVSPFCNWSSDKASRILRK